MQHRGDLMLAIMKRSVNMYMLYTRDNKIQPQTLLATKYRVFYLRIKSIMPLTSGEVLLEMNGFMVFICCPLHQCLLTLEARNLLKRNGMKNWVQLSTKSQMVGKVFLCSIRHYSTPNQLGIGLQEKDWDPVLIDNGMSRTWS